jgi:hypothetical protein
VKGRNRAEVLQHLERLSPGGSASARATRSRPSAGERERLPQQPSTPRSCRFRGSWVVRAAWRTRAALAEGVDRSCTVQVLRGCCTPRCSARLGRIRLRQYESD